MLGLIMLDYFMLHVPKGQSCGLNRKLECFSLKNNIKENTTDSNAYQMQRCRVTDIKQNLKNHINNPTTLKHTQFIQRCQTKP